MIKFDSIKLAYENKTVLEALSLEVAQGEKVVIWGKSGLGKSSLFALLLGFVTPDSGQVIFDNVPVNEKNIWGIRRQISFIDQDVSLGDGSVSDWFSFVSSLNANSNAKLEMARVQELMDFFEMSRDLLDKQVSRLSGGERQRAAIIVSVLLKRKVFLLDEVTSALDKHLKQKTAEFFLSQKEWTVMVISHDPVWMENPSVKIFDLEARQWKP